MVEIVLIAFVTLLTCFNLTFLYGTMRRLYKMDQTSEGRLQDMGILAYLIFQETLIWAIWYWHC